MRISAQHQLASLIGVTRTARVTGLDRAGVEVACAVRPLGHVLQVANGKGASWSQARLGALLEAAELWASERTPGALVFASADELRKQGRAHLLCSESATLPLRALRKLRLGWRSANDLLGGGELLVPVGAAHCLPPGAPFVGPLVHRWTSNGMGAHPEAAAALTHALFEALERDGLARALPVGWSPAIVRTRLLDTKAPAFAQAAPRTARLAKKLARAGLDPYLFDLRPVGFDLPLCGALLLDDPLAPVPLTAGYACAPGRDDALSAALLEAAQSRLTDIHGAREDVAHAVPDSSIELARAVRASPPRRSIVELPDHRVRGHAAAVRLVLRHLREQGVTEAAAVALTPSRSPVAVVKVIIPSLRVSELL